MGYISDMQFFHSSYFLLFAAFFFAIPAASLDKHGISGNVNYMSSLAKLNIAVIELPLDLAIGWVLNAIAIWSLFKLIWWQALLTIFFGMIVWGLCFGFILARLKKSDTWYSVVDYGVWIDLSLKLVASVFVVMLIMRYV